MTFEDTNEGDLVSITIHNQGKKLSLESHIIKIVDKCLVVEPFQVNGATINFPPNADIELMVVHDSDTPLYWQKVRIDMKLYRDANHHVITTKLPGVRMNRRGAFRVFIGQTVKANGIGSEGVNVTLRDLSAAGFSILTSKDIEIELHKKITVEYSDRAKNKYYELSGRPVRKSEIKGQSCYGCILDKKNPDLEAYLTQKQLENRPNSRKEI